MSHQWLSPKEMNNVKNLWLQGEQKKLIAEAFTAWSQPRIILKIRTYNLRQLPPSNSWKWLSAVHKAQLIVVANLKPDQHSARPQRMFIPGICDTQPTAPLLTVLVPSSHSHQNDTFKCLLEGNWSTAYLLIFSSYQKLGFFPAHYGKSTGCPFVNKPLLND